MIDNQLSTGKGASKERWLSLGLIILVCMLSYGLLVNQLGYDFDDWPFLFIAYSQSWAGLRETASTVDRPMVAILMGIFYSFLGLSPLAWHLAVFFLRVLMVILFWCGLRLLWPERRLETTFGALLFAVYPGYQHDPLILSGPVIYFPLTLYLISLIAMIGARRVKRWNWFLDLGALVCIPIHLLTYELAGGLEFLRPLILWHLSKEHAQPNSRSRIKWVIRWWAPYLLVFAAVVIYRLFIYATPRKSTSIGWIIAHYLDNPIYALGQHVSWGITGLMEAALVGWTPALGALTILTKSALVGWFLLLLSGGLVFTYSCYVCRKAETAASNSSKDNHWVWMMLFTGFFAIVLGVILPVLSFRVPLHQGEHSRFMMSPAMGASLFVVAFAKLALRPQFLNVFIGFLVGSCVAANFSNAWAFKKDWDFQRSLYWQLSWRAPVIRPGTVLLFDVPPSPVESRTDYVLAAPANFIYGNGASQPTLWAENLRKPRKPINQIILHQGGEFSRKTSSIVFQGNMRDSLVLYMDGRGVVKEPCLKVLSRDYPVPSSVSPIAGAVAAYSNLDRIMYAPKSSIPPGGVLGAEPPHRWCYYYQRIELFRQQQDWSEVARLTDEVRSKKYRPEDFTEWLPSIEGYLHVGRFSDARVLLTYIWEASPDTHWDACRVMERLIEAGKIASTDFSPFCDQ